MATAPPALEPFNSSKDEWHGRLVRTAMPNAGVKTIKSINQSIINHWNAWSRRFEKWLSLSSYSTGENADDKKRAAFCTYIDSATFKLLCSLCAPKKPEELTFEAMKAKLDSQYGTKKLVLAERYRFYNYKQREGQSLPDYIAELRCLAITCEWSEQHLEDNLRDKFVMDLRNERLLQQLLTQDHTKPLAELMELVHTFEAAERETFKRVDTSNSESSVAASKAKAQGHSKSNRRRQGEKQPAQPSPSGNFQSLQCVSCGGEHSRNTCRFRNVKCKRCNKLGHIARVCRSPAAAVVHNHTSESAVVTLKNKQDEQFIPPVYHVLYLPQLDKRL